MILGSTILNALVAHPFGVVPAQFLAVAGIVALFHKAALAMLASTMGALLLVAAAPPTFLKDSFSKAPAI